MRDGLLLASAYPHPVDRVELIETHISRVFLAGEYVYKVRRPVDFGFLNFSTLRRRLADCRREIALNRELAPGVYLGVERVTEDAGAVRIGGSGRVIEYAVRMRRLPAGAFLDAMIADGSARPHHLAALARRIAVFHAGAPAGEAVSRWGRPGVLRANWRQNFDQWAPWVGTLLSKEEDAELRRFVRDQLQALAGPILSRVAGGRVREGHGDLRAAQVAFDRGQVLVLDRLEFSRRLRSVDVASDIAFLMMDLEWLGRRDLAAAFLDAYLEATRDHQLLPLLGLFLCHRAAVRAKVAALRSAQLTGCERHAAEADARRLFELALSYVRSWGQPFLIVMSGLSGTGKSTLAAELSAATGAKVLASDLVRKRLAGVAPLERGGGADGAIYSADWTRRTYAAMFRRAATILNRRRPVILDATFLQRAQRQHARSLAAEHSARFLCVETSLDPQEARRRLDARAAAGASPSDATCEVYRAQRLLAEPVEELPAGEHRLVDMGSGRENALQAVLSCLYPIRNR